MVTLESITVCCKPLRRMADGNFRKTLSFRLLRLSRFSKEFIG